MHIPVVASVQHTETDITDWEPLIGGKDGEATIHNDLTMEAMLDTNRMSNEDRPHGLSRWTFRIEERTQ